MDPGRGEFLHAVVEGGLDAQLSASEAAAFAQRWLEIAGVCVVRLDAARKIRRNEVYFDRTELLAEIARHRAAR